MKYVLPQLANIFLQLLLKVPSGAKISSVNPCIYDPPLLSNGYIEDREHFAFMFTTSLCIKRNEHQKLVCDGAITGVPRNDPSFKRFVVANL